MREGRADALPSHRVQGLCGRGRRGHRTIMADTLAVHGRHLRRLVPEAAAACRFHAVVVEGTVHRMGCWDARGTGKQAHVSIGDLRPSTTCERCLRTYQLSSVCGDLGAFLGHLLEADHQLKRARREEGGDTRRILRVIEALRTAHRTLEARHPHPALGEADTTAVEAVLLELQTQQQRLRRLLRTPEERESVLSKVRRDLVGEVSGAYVLDERPALVGISPYQSGEWGQTVTALVEQCSLRERPVVLLVPRYVVEYVATTSGARRKGFQPSVDAGDASEAELETAALLWDPSSDGPLGSLAGALATARRV